MTNEPPPGYNRSRAALRDKFGSRRIDASAPQSKLDFTPSGRLRYHMGQNPKLSEDQADQMVAQDFRDMISGRPRTPNVNAPAQLMGAGAASSFPARTTTFTPANPSGAMVPVNGGGQGFIPNSTFEPATLNAPTMGGLSFDLNAPSLLPASTLASYMPSNTTAYTPSWLRRKAAPYAGAVLASVNRWLT